MQKLLDATELIAGMNPDKRFYIDRAAKVTAYEITPSEAEPQIIPFLALTIMDTVARYMPLLVNGSPLPHTWELLDFPDPEYLD